MGAHGGRSAGADPSRSQGGTDERRAVAAEERAAREEERELLAGVPAGAAAPSRLPLRRRALETLSWGPADIAWVAMRLELPEIPTRRLLDRLRDDGLVAPASAAGDDSPDAYDLTAAGERWLARHAVHGTAPEPPHPVGDDAGQRPRRPAGTAPDAAERPADETGQRRRPPDAQG